MVNASHRTRVEALKEYLQRRDLRVSEKKKEMVAQVFATAEQNFSPICMYTASCGSNTNRKRKSSYHT